uniref:Glycosyltransferase family 92 protein n=1 Tax=Steinernema glaseri TaxID=37863 RepID=A0A1I7YA83_9BILA
MTLARKRTSSTSGKEELTILPPRRITQRTRWILLILLLTAVLLYVNGPLSRRHVVVISSTYYANSRSITNNTVVVLFNSYKRWYLEKPLLCVSRNATHEKRSLAHVQHAFEPIGICRWTAFVAHCPTVHQPSSFELSTAQYFQSSAELPLRLPYQRKVDVVACFSPLFYNERWQLLVNTLEIYRQYGVGVQAYYVQSMLTEIMDLLKLYQKAGYVEIELWPMLSLGQHFEQEMGYSPNSELDFRNQASAHTDCLLKYKDAAKFIITSDIDDVLFPRLGETYIEEFMKLSRDNPFAAGFLYNRYKTEVTTAMRPEHFSLSGLIESAEIHDEWADGKSVYNPERVFTAWIHWPGLTHSSQHKMHLVSSHKNIMVHLRKWKMDSDAPAALRQKTKSVSGRSAKHFDVFDLRIRDLISPSKTRQLQAEFNRTYAQTEEFKKLPVTVRYYPLIADCYQKTFYDKLMKPDSCPGPINCFLPPMPDVRCSIAKANFIFNKVHEGLFVHYAQQARFVTHKDGCNMLP